MSAVAAAFWSEWPKLRRRSLLLGGVGTLLAFTILVTTLGIERATNGVELDRHGFRVSIQQLSQPDGLVHGITSASTLLGIVVLGMFAAAFGSEYSQGTLRALLVREPRRVRLLGGKLGALLVFGAAVVLLACAVSCATAFALGPSKGIDTSAWASSQGLHDLWVAVGHVILSCLGFGILGASPASAFCCFCSRRASINGCSYLFAISCELIPMVSRRASRPVIAESGSRSG